MKYNYFVLNIHSETVHLGDNMTSEILLSLSHQENWFKNCFVSSEISGHCYIENLPTVCAMSDAQAFNTHFAKGQNKGETS